MEKDREQSALIDHFVKQATALDAAASLANLVLEATTHPSLFAFFEILSDANLSKLKATPYSSYLDVLRLFTYGTWSDYKRNHGNLPVLLPDQVRKLKQLSVLTLAETEKELSYDQLMEELEISNVRELEDFLINECMYTGIIKGKLDQSRRCFEVQLAAGRDLRPKQLGDLIQTLNNWLSTSDDLLHLIQEHIKWADLTSEENKKHKKEIKDKVEEVTESVKAELNLRGGHEDFSEFSRMMDYEEERRVRPKRRRHPLHEGRTLFGDQLI